MSHKHTPRKHNMAKRLTSSALAVSTLLTILPSAAAADTPAEVLDETPKANLVFSLDFENLEENVGETLNGEFAAATEQTITPNDSVSVVEGRNGGKALDLSDKYLSTANTEELNPSSLTASIWLKRNSEIPTGAQRRVFWAKQMGTWDTDGWFTGWTNNEAMALVVDGPDLVLTYGDVNELLPMDEWVNIITMFDSETGELSIYKNGQEIASETIPGASITKSTAEEFFIGLSGWNDIGVGCVVDDIRIYDQALSAEEIADLVGMSSEDIANSDASSLSIANRVNSDFTLPVEGPLGSAITWESDNEAIVIDGANATVNRGNTDITVTLTATITNGDAVVTREFTVTVAQVVLVDALEKLDADEIINVGGTVGARIRDSVYTYAMD